MKNILFVDDSHIDKEALELLTSESNDFTIFHAESIADAKQIVQSEEIDVIVTDYHLNDGIGIDLIYRYSEIPVIIITGTNDIELSIMAMRAGAYDFLIKDPSMSYLKILTIACQQAIFRKTQEQHLQKMTQAVEQNPSLIMIANVHGVIEYANPKYVETTGYDMHEFIGANTRMLKSGVHDINFYKNLWDTITSGNKWTGEIYNRTKNGEHFWEFASIAPLKNRAGKVTHYIKACENITELKKAQKESEDAEKTKTAIAIAGSISHELNQPLQIILGYIELLKEKLTDNESASRQFQIIINNIDRIMDISKKLKNITDYRTRDYLDGTVLDIHHQGDEQKKPN